MGRTERAMVMTWLCGTDLCSRLLFLMEADLGSLLYLEEGYLQREGAIHSVGKPFWYLGFRR